MNRETASASQNSPALGFPKTAEPPRLYSSSAIKPRPAPTPWQQQWSRWWRVVVMAGIVVTSVTLIVVLISYPPAFYLSRVEGEAAEQQKALAKRFLVKGTRLISDIQNAKEWEVEFEESEMNAWLATDFEQNHAEHSLPKGVSKPRMAIDGDLLRIGFHYRCWPIDTVVQIGLRAWAPKRNVLALELEGAKAGALPLPTDYTRHVIEQIAYANNFEVTWKRNGSNLVALLEFPRGQRDVVLTLVEIGGGHLRFSGVSGRMPFPNADYAPAAN